MSNYSLYNNIKTPIIFIIVFLHSLGYSSKLSFKFYSNNKKVNITVNHSFITPNNISLFLNQEAVNSQSDQYIVPIEQLIITLDGYIQIFINQFKGIAMSNIVKLSFYFILLYFFTVVYNVSNKKVLTFLPLPNTVGVIQLLLGIPLFLPLWMVKPPKNLGKISYKSYFIVSATHAFGNLATIYSLESGSVSFTHVVKSAEPVFSAVLSALLTHQYFPISVYLTLLPIMIGVAIASATEISFNWFGFITAMLSNFFYQLRIVLSKQMLTSSNDNEKNHQNKIASSNLFRLITIISTFQLLPLAIILEGRLIVNTWNNALTNVNSNYLITNLLISGFSYYMYNEIAFWILDLVHPITHAIGNTIKRIVLIGAAIIIFKTPINLQGGIGSIIAILGSFLYAYFSSIAK